MGRRITQNIHECDICGKIPEDGEYLWEMGTEIWCEECCNNLEQDMWYCPNCSEYVQPDRVTYEETHEDCGNPVKP